jgi:hypothetical protein
LPADLFVQDAEATDDRRVDVREEAVGDALLLAELREDLLVVVGDRVELDSRGLELLVGVAQLTELRPARRSPDSRSIKDDDGLRLASTLVVVDELPVCVRQLEVRKAFSDLRTRRVAVRQANASWMPKGRWRIEAVVVTFYRHVASDGARCPRLRGHQVGQAARLVEEGAQLCIARRDPVLPLQDRRALAS